MDRRVAVAGAVVLLLSAVVVVQIADPRLGGRERPPEVDFSEPPNEVAADAAKQFEYVDYAYRVDIKYGENEEWRRWSETHVDHSNKTYRKAGPGGERQEVLYGTTAAGFVRPTIDEDWIVIGSPGLVYPVEYLTQPIHVDKLRDAEARVISVNSSYVTIYVGVHPLKVEANYPGNATLVVNRSTGMIQSLHIEYNPNGMGTQYLKLQVIETGTTVKRPKAIRLSPKEVFWDLVRGPIFRIDWLL